MVKQTWLILIFMIFGISHTYICGCQTKEISTSIKYLFKKFTKVSPTWHAMKLNWPSHELVLLGILQLLVELTCLCLGLLALRTFLAQFSLDLLHFLLQGFEAGTYTVKRGLEPYWNLKLRDDSNILDIASSIALDSSGRLFSELISASRTKQSAVSPINTGIVFIDIAILFSFYCICLQRYHFFRNYARK